ncbi:MvaI/BcnI restriction endonuclease family protein [Bradyrhizobium sp. 183]|nr:MvaI/BcnI restriction endonuclease family protein [Bradyrhizobium sp. 184]UPJ92107.1 MvaI/BcnI restriction endonuclease family protein [Bradyrhizobium sp. 183]
MARNGAKHLLVKELAANDNAKNQLYLSGSLDIANVLPMGEVGVTVTKEGNQILKAKASFFWIQPDGGAAPAPGAQFILYPQYPEVRLSALLRGAVNAPGELMSTRLSGRLLFLGTTDDGRILAWAAGPGSRLASEYRALGALEQNAVFFIVPLDASEAGKSTRQLLLEEIKRIHLLDWINSKALRADGTFAPCLSSHCIGYTLEAEFGVARNGRAEPDFKGWEIKAGTVSRLNSPPTRKAVTLMTPEPTGGFYRTDGVEAFVRKFGYKDKLGREDRLNFGGIYRAGIRHPGTGLTCKIDGFDAVKSRITNPAGSLVLLNDSGEIAAEWSFATLLSLWNRKHAQAVYVPAQARTSPVKQYRYGARVRLGTGTDFEKLLRAIAVGHVYYDPGIKLEAASTAAPSTKRRSQFRVPSSEIGALYTSFETWDVLAS